MFRSPKGRMNRVTLTAGDKRRASVKQIERETDIEDDNGRESTPRPMKPGEEHK